MGISWAYVNPNAKGTTNLKFSSLTSRILNRFGLNHFAHYDFFILNQNDLAYKSWITCVNHIYYLLMLSDYMNNKI